jgi:hypothetical protein
MYGHWSNLCAGFGEAGLFGGADTFIRRYMTCIVSHSEVRGTATRSAPKAFPDAMRRQKSQEIVAARPRASVELFDQIESWVNEVGAGDDVSQ